MPEHTPSSKAARLPYADAAAIAIALALAALVRLNLIHAIGW